MQTKHKAIAFSILTFLAIAVSTPVVADENRVSVFGQASATSGKSRVEIRTEIRTGSSSSTNRREEVRDRREERRENRLEDREGRKASSTERRIEIQQNVAKRKAERTAKLFLATIGRLEKIADRIDSRIAKVDALGGTTTQSKTFVAQAKLQLAEASTTVSAFLSLDLSGSKAKDNFEKIRELAKEVKDIIREAHRNLMMAVRALKPGRSNATSTATSTDDED